MTNYYSRSKGKFVDIATMPDQYVRNAFVKMCKDEPTEDVIFAQQQRERADNYKKLAEDNFASSVVDLDKIESLIKQNNKLQATNDKLKDTTRDIIKEKDLAIFTLRSSLDHNISEYKQLTDTLRDKGMYEPYDKQGRARDYQVEFTKLAKERDKWKEKSMNMVEKSSYEEIEETLKDTIKSNGELIQLNKQLKESLRQANLTPTVSTQAYDIAWQNIDELNEQVKSLLDRNAVLSRMYNASLSSNVTKGDSKMFSEIPNNPDGDMFICQLRQYLNKESYKIRVRGQYLKDEVKETEGWRRYEMGQPIEKSKCLRVYVDKK